MEDERDKLLRKVRNWKENEIFQMYVSNVVEHMNLKCNNNIAIDREFNYNKMLKNCRFDSLNFESTIWWNSLFISFLKKQLKWRDWEEKDLVS